MASWSEFKPKMAQALKDFEKNDESEIQMKRATLEIQQENQLSTTGNDKKVTKFLIIILTIKLVICLIIWIAVGRASDQEFDRESVRNRSVTSTDNLSDDTTENLTELA